MSVTRRSFFNNMTTAVASFTGFGFAPGHSKASTRKVSQDELTNAIADHAAWLEDGEQGQRAVFSNCDLSGLDFGSDVDSLINLRGADFSGSDMTGVTGRDVSFLRAAFHGTILSCSRFEQVIFSYASLRRARCDNVVWGWDHVSLNQPVRVEPGYASDFQHTDAGMADFTQAKIRGFFWESCFTGARLTGADFSYSQFCGVGFSETTFHAAELTSAKFRCTKLSHVKFSRANCAEIDFANADIGPRVRFDRASSS